MTTVTVAGTISGATGAYDGREIFKSRSLEHTLPTTLQICPARQTSPVHLIPFILTDRPLTDRLVRSYDRTLGQHLHDGCCLKRMSYTSPVSLEL